MLQTMNIYPLKVIILLSLTMIFLPGCVSHGSVRDIKAEIGDQVWPPTRNPKVELNIEGDYDEITFTGQIYRGLDQPGDRRWQGYQMTAFVKKNTTGVLANPLTLSDFELSPVGYLWISKDRKEIKVEFMIIEGRAGDRHPPTGLTPHPMNGTYPLVPYVKP